MISYGNLSVTIFAQFVPGSSRLPENPVSLCPDLHITRGEYDEETRYPETKTLTIGQLKLGVCHGHQVVLGAFAKIILPLSDHV